MDFLHKINDGDMVYIAGPMTGIEDYNRPAFHRVADALERHCLCEVRNPARHPDGWDYAAYMRKGIDDLLAASVVVVLPGWQKSRGARLELHLATVIGLPIYEVGGDLAEVGEVVNG